MLVPLSVFQDVQEKNKENPERSLFLRDLESQEVVEAKFNRGCLTVMCGSQMFDFYGRPVEIDPKITRVIRKSGRGYGYGQDTEAYLVRASNKKDYLAKIEYYSRKNGFSLHRWVCEMNPDFCRDDYAVRLVMTDLEVVSTRFLPESAAILKYFGNEMCKCGELWAVHNQNKLQDRVWLVKKASRPVDKYYLLCTEVSEPYHCCFYQNRKDEQYSYGGIINSGSIDSDFENDCFYEIGVNESENGTKIVALHSTLGTVVTDDAFIEAKVADRSCHKYIPFYLV